MHFFRATANAAQISARDAGGQGLFSTSAHATAAHISLFALGVILFIGHAIMERLYALDKESTVKETRPHPLP